MPAGETNPRARLAQSTRTHHCSYREKQARPSPAAFAPRDTPVRGPGPYVARQTPTAAAVRAYVRTRSPCRARAAVQATALSPGRGLITVRARRVPSCRSDRVRSSVYEGYKKNVVKRSPTAVPSLPIDASDIGRARTLRSQPQARHRRPDGDG